LISRSLTIRISFKERVENLQVARDLLTSPPLASQLEDVFGNEFVSSIGLAPFGPLSPAHRRVCFEGYIKSLGVLFII
jgi:hypothetical protein